MLVLSLLQLADHPGDTVARFHVARSPLGELMSYEDYSNDNVAADLSLRIREQMLERGFSRTIRHYAQRLAAKVDARNAGRLAQLCELSERYENQVGDDMQGSLRPASFVSFVRLMRMEEPQPAAVRVMTIHQSKGLEFDSVLVCDIEEPLRGHGYPLVAFERPSPVQPPTKAFRFLRSGYVALLPELEEMNAQAINLNVRERLSNLYVAITRPRHALHIVLQPNPKGLKTVSAVVRQALAPSSAMTPGQTIFEHGDPKWFARNQHAEPAAATPQARAPIRLRQPKHRALRRSPSAMEGGTRVDVGEHLRLDRRPGLARGSLIHKWMEAIEWLDDGEPSDAQLLSLTPQMAKSLSLEEELVRLRKALQVDAVRQALSRSRFEAEGALRVYRELPFAVREGEVLLSGSFDRVVVARGERTYVTIIDFKTDRVSEADINERVAYYRPQMDAYRRAAVTVFRAHIEDVRCELIFLALGRVVAVTE
jgi:ATP-dependent exoDNAse (exonuclease V) beta subunit